LRIRDSLKRRETRAVVCPVQPGILKVTGIGWLTAGHFAAKNAENASGMPDRKSSALIPD